ncbi:MAG: hypothetical protein K6E76_04795 [Patescibacteria group bacterium]|nr:hypothetical protein [Patescibacteria group bacterium]
MLNLYAHFEPNTCVIHTQTNKGNWECKYNQDCILPLPSRDGYDFSGWTYTGDTGTATRFQSGYNMKAIITQKTAAPSTTGCTIPLTANWDLHIYTITYKGPEPRTNDSANPDKYSIESAKIDLKRPLKI